MNFVRSRGEALAFFDEDAGVIPRMNGCKMSDFPFLSRTCGWRL